jgi:hypothetical protein
MEKFSAFNDPVLGINPFVNPARPRVTFCGCLKALLKLPLLLLLLTTNLNVAPLLISIKCRERPRPGVLASNASSFLDVHVLRHLTGITRFYYVTSSGFLDVKSGKFCPRISRPCVIFPEGCRTNNRAVLQFVRDVKVDHVCGLRYTGPCVNLYGSISRFFGAFLASENSVAVEFRGTDSLDEICEAAGLPQVKWGASDKLNFMKLVD